MKTLLRIALCSVAVLALTTANAANFSAGGTLGGQPINATATVTPGAGTITVTLNNLQADPTSIIQMISGIQFDVSGASGSGLLTTVNSGNIITISAGGAHTSPTADALTRWKATETGNLILLTTLSGGNPDRLIIGPPNGSNLYANANASIIGDNPSVFETATFTITVPGVTVNSLITDGVILFGTGGDTNVPDGGTTIALFGFALVGIECLRRQLSRA